MCLNVSILLILPMAIHLHVKKFNDMHMHTGPRAFQR